MRCHVTWHCLFSSAQTASLLWGHLPWCVEAQMMWGSPRVATTMLFYMQCHPGQKPKHLGGLRETLQAISYITIHHEVALSPRPISAGLPHRAAVLYIKPNHEAVLSPSLDPYLQVFHIGLQVLPAPVRCTLKSLTSFWVPVSSCTAIPLNILRSGVMPCATISHPVISVNKGACFPTWFMVSQSVRNCTGRS